MFEHLLQSNASLQLSLDSYRGQISVHAPSHKLFNEEFHLIPREKRSRRPLPTSCSLQLVCPFPLLPGEKAEELIPSEPRRCCPGERQPMASSPGLVRRPMTSLPVSIKLQVTPVSR